MLFGRQPERELSELVMRLNLIDAEFIAVAMYCSVKFLSFQ
jgi:hypothetical protein